MGKKSRLKRQRKAILPNKKNVDFEQFVDMMTKASSKRSSVNFEKHIISLIELFKKFNAEDVLLSLEISDLWLHNISSPAKHQLALSAFVSIDESQFFQSNRLDTYEKFKFFIEDVYKLLPSMGMLEDYVPTLDWGAIRSVIDGEYRRIFSGGCVERISDFIEAFRLSYEDDSPPLHDMKLALQIQNQIISCVDLCMVGDIGHIQPGHIEVPDENFWLSCREALHSCSQMLLEQKDKINPKMSINLGESKKPGTWSEFGNAFSEGEALPILVINVGCKPMPVSIRNLATVVIDYWSRASINEYLKKRINLTEDIAQFLSLRIPTNVLFSGPLALASRTNRLICPRFDGHLST